jgi:hypothetical protein
MKRLLIAACLAALASPVWANIQPKTGGSNPDCSQRLIAGQNIDVGRVDLTWRSDELHVNYIIESPGWKIKEVHFGTYHREGDLPIHAIPGQMLYGREGLDHTGWSFTIDREHICPHQKVFDPKCDSCDCWFAAHAVVERDCPKGKGIYRPGNYATSARVKVNRQGRSSYFNLQIEGDGINAVVNNGWCLDARKDVPEGIWMDAGVIYEWDELETIVDNPENMPYIQWIAEQNFVGRTSRCGAIVNRDHVQNAIWNLAHDRGVGCVARSLVNEARRSVRSKDIERSCWEMAADFVIQPCIHRCEVEGDAASCYCDPVWQPIYSYKFERETCPTNTPTPTATNTRTATPSSTQTPTRTATLTPSTTPTGTPPPTATHTPTATATDSPTDTPTATPTATSTPSPCPPQRETAWAFGSVEFGIGWGWFFECCEDD